MVVYLMFVAYWSYFDLRKWLYHKESSIEIKKRRVIKKLLKSIQDKVEMLKLKELDDLQTRFGLIEELNNTEALSPKIEQSDESKKLHSDQGPE
mmetsp:Transcript_32905/g.50317  ORF Transcript_32905/g.50317 Transcript_32905/m.50317 type:complete len:94 (-) Transcript_32905:380-661(-)